MTSIFLKKLFFRLNSKSIEYCVWGNYDYLPESLNGSDLDIVIKSQSKFQFKKILIEETTQLGAKIVSYFDTANTEHYRIIGAKNSNSWGIMIDLIYDEFHYKNYIYFPSNWVWKIQNKHNGIIVNDKRFSYLAGFLKELLHNGFVKDRYLINFIADLKVNPDYYEPFLNEV